MKILTTKNSFVYLNFSAARLANLSAEGGIQNREPFYPQNLPNKSKNPCLKFCCLAGVVAVKE